ncbi:unnamed protein product [Closterium sp. NIES-64]|nr:unnamed protein product [Closterium sp. NIES-64]
MRGEWNTKAVRDGLDAILCHAEAVYQANMANRKASLGGHLQPMLKDFHHMRMHANMANRKASLGGHLQPMLKDFHHMRMRVLPFPLPLLFFPQISLSHHLQANMANRKANMANRKASLGGHLQPMLKDFHHMRMHANMANRKASLGGHLQPMLKDFHHMRMRVLIPTYPCPYEERVGAWGVGGKWVCLIPTAVQAKPVVYSVGSDEEYSFEESMFRHYRSQPYTLDPFLSPQAQARMQLLRFLHFHSLGLAGKASLGDYQKWNPNVTFRTLPELMQACMQLLRFLHFHSVGLSGRASLGDYQKWNPNVTISTTASSYIGILKLSCGGCEEEEVK